VGAEVPQQHAVEVLEVGRQGRRGRRGLTGLSVLLVMEVCQRGRFTVTAFCCRFLVGLAEAGRFLRRRVVAVVVVRF